MNKKINMFVNTNAIHNVPESGYNQIDVARIDFIIMCESMCYFATDYHISLSWFINE